jgi:hypothetical protein
MTISLQYTIPDAMPAHVRACITEAYTRLLNTITLAEADLSRAPAAAARSTPILRTWDRGRVLQQIEEASGQALSAGDTLPDSLMASAQALGMEPHELGVWIYETDHNFQTGQLIDWALRNGFGTAPEATA